MLRSLRARLVLFCVLPLVVAGVVMAPLALRAFDDYQSQRNEEALRQLQEQSAALAALYGKQVRRYFEEGGEPGTGRQASSRRSRAPTCTTSTASTASCPPRRSRCRCWAAAWTSTGTRSTAGESQTLRSVALPGREGRYLVVVTGVFTTDEPGGAEDLGAVGAFALAAPVEDLSSSGTDLFWRVAPAFAVAIVVAMLLALYLGWEVSRPLRRLVVAAGAIGRGRYDVHLDRSRPDEIGVVNRAFGDMVDRLRERAGARAAVPHARLPRAAHAADRHPRPRAGAGGRRHRHGGRAARGVRRHRRRGQPPGAPHRRPARPGEAGGAPLHAARRGGRPGVASSTTPCRRAARTRGATA